MRTKRRVRWPYDATALTAVFATRAHALEGTLGDFVALVMRAQSVERMLSTKGEPYLVVHGIDMDGKPTGPLRLWRFSPEDVEEGSIYIVRGLKIVRLSIDHGKYLACFYRTAAENVSNVPAIAAWFE